MCSSVHLQVCDMCRDTQSGSGEEIVFVSKSGTCWMKPWCVGYIHLHGARSALLVSGLVEADDEIWKVLGLQFRLKLPWFNLWHSKTTLLIVHSTGSLLYKKNNELLTGTHLTLWKYIVHTLEKKWIWRNANYISIFCLTSSPKHPMIHMS